MPATSLPLYFVYSIFSAFGTQNQNAAFSFPSILHNEFGLGTNHKKVRNAHHFSQPVPSLPLPSPSLSNQLLINNVPKTLNTLLKMSTNST
jgi:hypothetical protein